MNVERMRKVADALDAAADMPSRVFRDDEFEVFELESADLRRCGMDGFDMTVWYVAASGGEHCSTLGCVAGWTCHMFPDEVSEIVKTHVDRLGITNIDKVAREILGLTKAEGAALFEGLDGCWESSEVDLEKVTAKDAARALRNAAFGMEMAEWWSHVRAREDAA